MPTAPPPLPRRALSPTGPRARSTTAAARAWRRRWAGWRSTARRRGWTSRCWCPRSVQLLRPPRLPCQLSAAICSSQRPPQCPSLRAPCAEPAQAQAEPRGGQGRRCRADPQVRESSLWEGRARQEVKHLAALSAGHLSLLICARSCVLCRRARERREREEKETERLREQERIRLGCWFRCLLSRSSRRCPAPVRSLAHCTALHSFIDCTQGGQGAGAGRPPGGRAEAQAAGGGAAAGEGGGGAGAREDSDQAGCV